MFDVGLSKNKQALLDYLGFGYRPRVIDFEECIYRDFGEYDVEISGGHRKGDRVIIYLWRKKDYLKIVERVDIPKGDFEQVEFELFKLIIKYKLVKFI